MKASESNLGFSNLPNVGISSYLQAPSLSLSPLLSSSSRDQEWLSRRCLVLIVTGCQNHHFSCIWLSRPHPVFVLASLWSTDCCWNDWQDCSVWCRDRYPTSHSSYRRDELGVWLFSPSLILRFLITGHATHRLLVERGVGASKNKEVVVWSIGFLSNHTIISGDSAGKVQIWDGLTGTLVRSHLVSRWDVLVLSVSQVRWYKLHTEAGLGPRSCRVTDASECFTGWEQCHCWDLGGHCHRVPVHLPHCGPAGQRVGPNKNL